MNLEQIIGTHLSGERIDFQKNSAFVEEMTKEFEAITEDIISLGDYPNAGTFKNLINKKSIRDCIMKHTGLNVDLNWHPALNASVAPPIIGRDNVISTGFFEDVKISKGFKTINDNNKKPVIISVDLKRGYVHGVKDIKLPILLSHHYFYKSAKHALAIFMHEIGHLISLYYSFVMVSVPNFLLGEFTDRLFEIKDDKTRAILVSKVDRELPLKDQKAILEADDKETVRLFLVDDIKRKNRSMFGSDFYDKRAWEAMADNYVVKHGLYLELSEVFREDFTIGGKLWQAVVTLIELVPPVFIMTFIAAWMDPGDSYDEPFQRLKVVRKQAIAELKVLDPKDAKDTVEKIDRLTALIDDEDDIKLIGVELAKLFVGSVKDKHNSRELQKALEHFSHSEFNVLTAKLKQL